MQKVALQSNAKEQTAEQIYEKIERYTEDYEWEEV